MDRKCHAKFVNDRGGGGGGVCVGGGAVDLSAPCRQHRETGCSGFIGYAKERVVCLQSGGGGGGGGVALTVFCVSENHFICKS